MQEEIQNNRPGWRNRLDDLEAVAGEETWDKLHSRLQNKKRNNKPVWWYIAAACAIFIFFLLSFFRSDNNVRNEIVKTTKKENLKMTLLQPAPIVKSKKRLQKKFDFVHTKIDTQKETAIQVAQPATIDPEKNLSLTVIEIPSVAPKKKLRVVHINELQPNNDEEKQNLAQNEKTKTKRGKNKNLIRSYVSNSTSDKALKINFSPSN
jgi:hypothetical protein